MTVASKLHLRLFLEGVEVPPISAVVQSQKNSAAVASIAIPFNDEALEFKPRTLVHLYFYDFYQGSPPDDILSVRGDGITVVQQQDETIDPELAPFFPPERFESTTEQDTTDLENSNYRLLFGGEVVGFHYNKTPDSRMVVLQCVDWSSYWDIAFQYQMSGFSLGGGGIRMAFTGARATVFNSFLDGSADIITQLINTPPRSYPELRGTLLGGLMHIIEAMGGVYFGERAVRGINDFFSLAEMRLHLTQMIGANPYAQGDEVRLLRAHGFGSLFRRRLAGLGKLVSIRQVLLALQPYIFHEILPITTPRYVPPARDPNIPQVETVAIGDTDETRPIARTASRIKERAEELKQRQEASTDAEAARQQSDQRGGLVAELRQLSRLCNVAARNARLVGIQSAQYGDLFAIPEVSAAFSNTASSFTRIADETSRGQRPGVRSNTFYLPGTQSAQTVTSELDRIIERMDQVLNSEYRRRVPRTRHQPFPPPRLLTQIYSPDVWMVAPPRCNVIFPELYSTLNYSRDYNAEVSRLLLRTHSAFFGSDILFDGFYIAPSNVVGQRTNRTIDRGRTNAERPMEEMDSPAWVARDFMEHELFTGIIPTFERMSDLNLHAIRGGSINIDGQRVGYAELAANHIFFQYRFRSRQLSVSGKFNPFVAFGFPTVIIDRQMSFDTYTGENWDHDQIMASRLVAAAAEGDGVITPPQDQETIDAVHARLSSLETEILRPRENTHYLGTPQALTHSVSAQSGGTTQIDMGYARTTNERMEYFGDNDRPPRRVRRTRNVRVNTEVAAQSQPATGIRGPRGGRIEEVRDITEQFQRRGTRAQGQTQRQRARRGQAGAPIEDSLSRSPRRLLPLFVPEGRGSGRRGRQTQVEVGVSRPVSDYPPEVAALVGTGGDAQPLSTDGAEVQVEFRAYKITETLGAYRTEQEPLPPEDLTFPPWYGDHYRTQNIGGLYSYFFGVGALTDPTTFLGTPSGEFGQLISEIINEDGQDRALAVRVGDRLASGGADTPQTLTDYDAELLDDEEIGPAGDPMTVEEREILAEVQARSPIASALDEVVRAYSLVRRNKYDVHEFLRAYGWRPIASAVDMFGTSNLEINAEGEVVRGIEGFHSRAFGDFDDLRQLVAPGDGRRPRTILGLQVDDESGESDEISARLDTRREKRRQVLRYLSRLLSQNGILG